MAHYLGVDCGLSGALAVIETVNGLPTFVDVIDMPIMGSGAKTRVDVLEAVDWIRRDAPSACYLERAQAMPRQGSSSGFIASPSAECRSQLSNQAHGSAASVLMAATKKVPASGQSSFFRNSTHSSPGARTTGGQKLRSLVVANLGRVPHG